MTAWLPACRSRCRTGAIRPTARIGGSAARCTSWSSAPASARRISTASACRASPSGPDTAVGLTQHFGLSPRWLDHIPFGGASGIVALRRAARAVQAGDADIVACVAGDTNHVDSFRKTLSTFSRFAQDAVYPYGSGGANASFALITKNYMNTYGAQARGLRQALRRAARQRAVDPVRDDEEEADARRIHGGAADRRSDPSVRLRDALRRRRGVPGVPRGHREIARTCRACASSRPSSGTTPIPTTRCRCAAAGRSMSTSCGRWRGCKPADVDFVETYDDYPVIVMMQLEDLGFCKKGEGAGLRPRAELHHRRHVPAQHLAAASSRSARPARPAGCLGLVEAMRQLTGAADRHAGGRCRASAWYPASA